MASLNMKGNGNGKRRRRLIGNHLSSEELLDLCIEHGYVPRPN